MNLLYGIKSILAIDDNIETLFELRALITEAFPGIKFLSATSVFDGLDICRNELPRVVLLNMTMPEMPGTEVCSLLKTDPVLENIRVVLMTSPETDRESRIKALENRVDGFLSKPVERPELIVQIRAMLRINEGEDSTQNMEASFLPSESFEKHGQHNEIEWEPFSTFEEHAHHGTTELPRLKTINPEIPTERPGGNEVFGQQRKYFDIFNSTTEGIYISDLNTRSIIDVNQALLKMFGFESKEEVLYGFGGLGTNMEPFTQVQAKEHVKKAIVEGPQTFEWLAEKKNGERFWTEVSLKLTHIDDKSIIVTIIRNINHRKKIEDTQQFLLNAGRTESGAGFFKSVVKYLSGSLNMCYVSIERLMPDQVEMQHLSGYLDGKFTDFDSYAFKDTPCEAALGKTIYRFDRNIRVAFPRDAVIGHIGAECFVGSTLWSSAGKPMGLIVLMNRQPLENHTVIETVLTMASMRVAAELERQETETALIQSRKAFQNYFQNCAVGMSVTSPDKKWLEVNQSLCRMLGYSKEELSEMNWTDLTFPDDLEKNLSPFNEMAAGRLDRYDLDKRFIRKDGTLLYVTLSVVCERNPDGSLSHILGSYIDVTARHLAEEAIRQERLLLRTLVDNLPDSIYVKNVLGQKIVANKADLQFMGYTSESEILGKTDMEIYPGTKGVHGYHEDLQVIQTGIPITNKESVYIGADNKQHWRVSSKYPFFDDNHKIQGLVGIGFDITDRKLTEEALKSSEELYRNLIEKLPDGVYKISPDGRFISVNPAMMSILGYNSREELFEIDIRKELYFDPQDRFRSPSKDSKHDFNVYKLKKKDLSEIWVEDHSWFNRDEKGNIISCEGIIRDVTDRKRNEDRLRSLSRAVEQNPVTILITDTQGRIEYVNPKFTDLTGYSPDEVKGQTPAILKSGDTPSDEYSRLWKIIREGGEWQGEFKNKKKSGEEYFENALISPIKDDYGNITHFLAVKEDITERKKAEETIREINRKLAYAQQMARIGNWEIYLPTGELHWSEEMSQIIGYSHDHPVNISELANILPPAEYERFKQAFNDAVLYGEPFSIDYRIIGSDGVERYIHDEGEISHDEQEIATWMYGTSQDITERKQAELALQESNELNSSLLQSIPFGMDIVDEQGNILFQSENLGKLFGQHEGEQPPRNLYHDNQRPFANGPLYADIQIGMTRISETNFLPGSRIFQIFHTGMLFKGKKAILEIFQDITEKKEVEKKVKLLAHSLEGISECVSITDTDDNLIYVNESFLTTYGYTGQELIGQHINIVRTKQTMNGHVRDILPETIEGGWRGEIMNVRKDGTEFPILLSTSVIKDENQHPIALIGVAIDITEMKKNREELIAAKESAEESNRLKSAFLATMNHELRTPLNHILGFSELIMSGVATEDNVSFATSIHTSGQSLLSIIEGVFDLALVEHANIKLRKQTFSLMDHFMENKASFDNILRTSAKHEQIHLVFRPDARWLSSYVTADRSKINQILTNLFRNAVKFTHKGTIEFGYRIEDKSRLTFYVKDTGIGIPIDKQAIIFDFFRQGDDSYTRVYGGIGIGLAISQKIAKILDGELSVVSEPGIGSTFLLTIPVELSSERKGN